MKPPQRLGSKNDIVEGMKKLFAKILYVLNISMLLFIAVFSLWGGYIIFSQGSLALTQAGVPVWDKYAIEMTCIMFALPIISFLVVWRLRVLRAQERFTGVIVWGLIGMAAIFYLLAGFFGTAIVGSMS